jgi:hypothetical protein
MMNGGDPNIPYNPENDPESQLSKADGFLVMVNILYSGMLDALITAGVDPSDEQAVEKFLNTPVDEELE